MADEVEANPSTPSEPPPPPTSWWKRRKKGQRIALIALGSVLLFAVLVLVAAPPIVGSIVESKIRSAVLEELGAQTRIRDVDFRWPARIVVKELEVTCPGDSDPLISVDRITVKFAPGKILLGDYDLEFKVEKPVLTILQRADGSFNYQRPSKSARPQTPTKPSPVRYALTLSEGEIRFKNKAGRSSIVRGLSVRSDFDSKKSEGVLLANAPGVDFHGIWKEIDGLENGELSVTGVELADYSAISEAYGGPSRLEGSLKGGGELQVVRADKLQGALLFQISGWGAAGGPLGDRPLRLENASLALCPKFSSDRFESSIGLQSGRALSVSSRIVRTPGESTEITASIQSDLAELIRQSSDLLRLKRGARLEGRAVLEASVTYSSEGCKLRLDGSVDHLTAVEEMGPVSIDPHVSVALDGSWRSKEASIEIHRAELKSQNLILEAKGGVGGLRADSNWTIRDSSVQFLADLGMLSRKLKSFLDLPVDVSFGGVARLDAHFTAGRLDSKAELKEVFVFGLGENKDNYGPLDLSITQRGTLDARGDFAIETSRFLGSSIDLEVKGRIQSLLAPERRAKLNYSFTLRPAKLSSELAGFFTGLWIGGQSVTCVGDVDASSARTSLGGQLRLDGLTLTAPLRGTSIVRAAPAYFSVVSERGRVTGLFDEPFFQLEGGQWGGATQKKVRCDYEARDGRSERARYGSETGWAEWNQGVLKASFGLDRILSDLRPILDLPQDYQVKGALEAESTLRYDESYVNASGKVRITNLELAAGGRKISENSVEAAHDFSIDRRRSLLLIRRFDIASSSILGGVRGTIRDYDRAPEFVEVRGTGAFVPERLDVLLRPWLPGRLEGSRKEKIEVAIDGKASDYDWLNLVRGTTGSLAFGLGKFTMSGMSLEGSQEWVWHGGRLTTRRPLSLNEGTTELGMSLDFRDPVRASGIVKSTLGLKATDARANADMAPMLSILNPLFFTTNGSVRGIIQSEAYLKWEGGINPAAEWLPQAVRALKGDIRFSARELQITGSPALAEILSLLGEDPTSIVGDIPESRLACRDGKIHLEDFVVRLKSCDLKFTGSIGFDETLDLKVEMPVSAKLAEKHGLESFAGKTLLVPLTGTVRRPKLDAAGAIRDLRQK